MFSLFNKNREDKEQPSKTNSKQVSDELSDWNDNLAWSEENAKKIYEEVKQQSTDPEKIASAAHMASNSKRIYSTLAKDDTNLVILVRKMESFPKPAEIADKREYYSRNVKKLEKAKKALVELMKGLHDSNSSLTLAYTAIDSDLRHAIVEERSFEAKLKMEAQSIEDLVDLFRNTPDYSKVLLLSQMYGFQIESQSEPNQSEAVSAAEIPSKPKKSNASPVEVLKSDFTQESAVIISKNLVEVQ